MMGRGTGRNFITIRRLAAGLVGLVILLALSWAFGPWHQAVVSRASSSVESFSALPESPNGDVMAPDGDSPPPPLWDPPASGDEPAFVPGGLTGTLSEPQAAAAGYLAGEYAQSVWQEALPERSIPSTGGFSSFPSAEGLAIATRGPAQTDAPLARSMEFTNGAPVPGIYGDAWGSKSFGATPSSSGAYPFAAPSGNSSPVARSKGNIGVFSPNMTPYGGQATGKAGLATVTLDATIKGTVREANGNPVAGTQVDLWGPSWGTGTQTDVFGAYTLNVPGGTWRMGVRKPGYVHPWHIDVSVSSGGTVTGIDFTLTPATAWVVGTVRLGEGGPPVPNAWVWTYGWGGTQGGGGVNADASGVYSVGVVAGTWYLISYTQGYTLRETPFATIANGQTITGKDLVLLTNRATISGAVRDQYGNPVNGASVWPRDPKSGHPLNNGASSNAQGNYSFGIATGTWLLQADKQEYRPTAGRSVVVPAGDNFMDLTMSVLDATIRGTVRDSNGNPVSGANMGTGVPGWGANAQTDASGNYTLTVHGGTWWVGASKTGWLYGPSQDVTVSNRGSVSGIDFILTPATAWVTGAVRLGDGGPVMPNAWVWTWNWGGPQRGAGVNADATGVFTLGVAAGTWFLISYPDGYTLRATPFVTVVDGQTLTGRDLVVLANTATITGTVRDQYGSPVDGAWLSPRDPTSGHSLNNGINANTQAAYSLPIAGGTWLMNAVKDGYRASPYQTVSVVSGGIAPNVNLTMTRLDATIRGTVRDTNGNPVGGTRVDVWSSDWGTGTQTDTSGAYTLTVSGGIWRMGVGKPGYVHPWHRDISVAPGGSVIDVDFRLTSATAWVVGTVRAGEGGPPMLDADVWTWGSGSTQGGARVNAGANGVYTLGLTAGTWYLISYPQGYTLRETPIITIASGQTITGRELIVLTNTATISGTVRDQYGNPVAGTSLSPRDPTTRHPLSNGTSSNAQGSYSLGVGGGTWLLVADKQGYRTSADQRASVIDGGTATNVNLTLTALDTTIRGTVRDGSGNPVAGANVSTGVSDWGTSTKTDASGSYTLTVYGGAWSVSASKSGYRSAPSRTVTVPDAGTASGVDFTLNALNATIRGTVRDASNGPLAGADVSTKGPGFSASTQTDASGSYTLTVYAGTWEVTARKKGYVYGSSQYATVADGGTTSGVDFVLTPATVWLVGTVRAGDGGPPMPNAYVWTWAWGGPQRGAQTNADASGVYTLAVAAGTWYLISYPQGYSLRATPFVTVTDGQTLIGNDLIVLTNTATVTGTVRDQYGNPVSGVSVRPRDPNSGHQLNNGASSDAAGVYSVSIAAGTWQLQAERSAYRSSARQTVSVSDGATAAGVDFAITALDATIKGSVRDGNGNPVSGASVNTGDKNWGTSAKTDAGGSYTLTVHGGAWSVSASKSGYRSAPSRTVTVSGAGSVSDVNFTLNALNATVRGRVRDGSNNPISGVNMWASISGWSTSGQTDASGNYTLTVHAGTWSVSANKSGWVHGSSQSVTVADGGAVSGLDFTLTPPMAWVTGAVRLGDGGSPIPNAWVWTNCWNCSPYRGAPAVNADASGVYTLGVTAGTWYFISYPQGYTLRETPFVTITDGQRLMGNDLIVLTNTATVTGTIRDQYGNPVSGVFVRPRDPNSNHDLNNGASSDATGVYSLSIAAGTWQIQASRSGYRSPSRQTVSAGAGATAAGVDFVVTALDATIRGTVRDAGGNPVAGASAKASVSGWSASAQTDASGSYSLTVYGGAWSVSASKSGYRSGPSRTVTVPDAGSVSGVDFILTALNATVRGTVRDGLNNALAGVTVNASVPGWGTSAQTDASGNYTLTVHAGTWWVSAQQAGWVGSAGNVNVPDGGSVSGVDRTLTPATAWATGTIRLGEGGPPVANAWVWTWAWGGPSRGAGINADASGAYTLGVAAGTWYLISYPQGYTLRATPFITIADGQTLGGNDLVILTNTATITGTITDELGNPLAGARVTPRDPRSNHELNNGTTSRPDGTYSLALAAGTWQIQAEKQGYQTPPRQTVSIGEGTTVGGVNFVLTAVYKISGIVRSQGIGVGGIVMCASSTPGPPTVFAMSDSSGRFDLKVGSGNWGVGVCSAPGYVWGPSQWAAVPPDAWLEFDIARATSLIRGTVNYTDSVASNLRVTGRRIDNTASYDTRSDSSGAFTLTVSDGIWSVWAGGRTGYTLQSTPLVTLTNSQTVTGVSLLLLRNSSFVFGAVRDQYGESVEALVSPRDPISDESLANGAGADASGFYTLSIAAGTWRLGASPRPSSPYVRSDKREVFVPDGGAVSNVNFVVNKLDSYISGYVRDADGNPVVGDQVIVQGSQQIVTRTDSLGFYRVQVWGNHSFTVTVVHSADVRIARTVSVGRAEDKTGVNFEVPSVSLLIRPSAATVGVGAIVILELWLNAGDRGIASIDAFLDFDPAYLEVVDAAGNPTTANALIPGSAMPVVNFNQADNSSGRIDYSAGMIQGGQPVTGSVLFASVRFRGKAETALSDTQVRFHVADPRPTLLVDGRGNPVSALLQGSSVRVTSALLVGTVSLQARGNSPSTRWMVPLTVTLHAPGVLTPTYLFTPTADTAGQFTVTGFALGTYDIKVKKAHTLANKRANVSLTTGTNRFTLGDLLEGDANDNGVINSLDYAPLATAYFKQRGQVGFDGRVDFNDDGRINSQDYAPLAANYFKRSDIGVSGAGGQGSEAR